MLVRYCDGGACFVFHMVRIIIGWWFTMFMKMTLNGKWGYSVTSGESIGIAGRYKNKTIVSRNSSIQKPVKKT